MRKLFTSLDLILLGAALLLIYPAYKLAHLPLRIDFRYFAIVFWTMSVALAPFAAIVFVLIGRPEKLRPYLTVKRLAIGSALCAVLVFISGAIGVVEAVAVLVVAEVVLLGKKSLAILIPVGYVLIVELIQGSFNHAIAGIRNPQLYDSALNNLDRVLFGFTAVDLNRWAMDHYPHWCFNLLDGVYNTLFIRLLAVLMVCTCLKGQRYAMAYARTIALCYAIGLVVYFAVPAKGPYSIEPSAQTWTKSYLIQKALTNKSRMIWAHGPEATKSMAGPDDYYISFPSLHVALPLVAIWFLRPWKRLAWIYSVYYVFWLLPSIFLLEWHYFIDFFGGIATAAVVLWIAGNVDESETVEL